MSIISMLFTLSRNNFLKNFQNQRFILVPRSPCTTRVFVVTVVCKRLNESLLFENLLFNSKLFLWSVNYEKEKATLKSVIVQNVKGFLTVGAGRLSLGNREIRRAELIFTITGNMLARIQ